MQCRARFWKQLTHISVAIAVFGLAGCGGSYYDESGTVYPENDNRKTSGSLYKSEESVFGDGGLDLFGEDKPEGGGDGAGIGVNSFLWRASLDTISFMPLASADPFGGVIITDWYSPPESRAERFKINLYILGRDLRADGVRASVFRQLQDQSGGWSDAAVEPKTSVDIENAILSRARQLRIAALQ